MPVAEEDNVQKVKIFKGLESDTQGLEQEVNSWIASSGAQVLQITGNIAPQSAAGGGKSGALLHGAHAPSDVLLIIVYDS